MEYAARRGYLVPAGDRCYRRTWLGAVYGAFQFLPRLKESHMRRMAQDGLRLLRELGIDPRAAVRQNYR
jgi:hypothetical protein